MARSNRAPRGEAAVQRAEKLQAGKVPDLDRLIHERIRLGIVSALAANESLSFSDLKQLLETTDGNLSVHARKLEEAGYISCRKHFEGRTPKTEFRITALGRKAFHQYLNHMEALVRAMRSHSS
ncbi:MAG: transcriptional regulator [Bryobacteraceae bacterium]|nr:transcriptional regulator [Bryobacteraceae bacterium]MDW8379786.1 transcriptional regulator [Bryobacterales bacterium]